MPHDAASPGVQIFDDDLSVVSRLEVALNNRGVRSAVAVNISYIGGCPKATTLNGLDVALEYLRNTERIILVYSFDPFDFRKLNSDKRYQKLQQAAGNRVFMLGELKRGAKDWDEPLLKEAYIREGQARLTALLKTTAQSPFEKPLDPPSSGKPPRP